MPLPAKTDDDRRRRRDHALLGPPPPAPAVRLTLDGQPIAALLAAENDLPPERLPPR